MKHSLIIGATSDIAKSTARLLANAGDALYLVARDEAQLKKIADDLIVRGASQVSYGVLDVNESKAHQACLEAAFNTLTRVDRVLIAHGVLPCQKACEHDADLAMQALNVNAVSTVSLLTELARRMEKQQQGVIAVITSVAACRGRASNYVYGASKALLATFLQGLADRLSRSNIQVVDIRPGLVDSKMTAHLAKGLLWAKPLSVAKDIVKSMDKGQRVVYSPFFWRYIMMVICAMPSGLFKRLKL